MRQVKYYIFSIILFLTIFCLCFMFLDFNLKSINVINKNDINVSSIPLEESALAENILISPKINLILRQALRLIDQQFVLPNVLFEKKHILYVLSEFGKKYSHNFELKNVNPNLKNLEVCNDGVLLKICSHEKSINDNEKKLIFRVGNRIFKSPSDTELGHISYVELVAKVLISQLPIYEDVSQKDILYLFLNKYLESIDPHSSYLTNEEYTDLRNGSRGLAGGMGIVVQNSNGMVFIKEVIKNSSAHEAGFKAGDIILKVGNGFYVYNDYNLLLEKLKNYQGEEILLYRPLEEKVIKAKIKKSKFKLSSVILRRSEDLPDVLFFRLTSFNSGSANEILNLYKKSIRLRKYKGMVLDLRGNPGGLLEQAQEVSNLFLLGNESIVSTQTRYETTHEYAKNSQEKIELPLVVLIDSGSASASEIVAAALQDNGRAVILGEQSFGKGSVQSLFEFYDHNALKLTIANYFTPLGNSIQNYGIQPDIEVKILKNRMGGLWVVGKSENETEKDLYAHLGNPLEKMNLVNPRPQYQVYTMGVSESLNNKFLIERDFAHPIIPINEDLIDFTKDPILKVGVEVLNELNCKKNVMVLCKKNIISAIKKEKTRTLSIISKSNLDHYSSLFENFSYRSNQNSIKNFINYIKSSNEKIILARSENIENMGSYYISSDFQNDNLKKVNEKFIPKEVKAYITSVMHDRGNLNENRFEVLSLGKPSDKILINKNFLKNKIQAKLNLSNEENIYSFEIKIINVPNSTSVDTVRLNLLTLQDGYEKSLSPKSILLYQNHKGDYYGKFSLNKKDIDMKFSIVLGFIENDENEVLGKIPIIAVEDRQVIDLASFYNKNNYN